MSQVLLPVDQNNNQAWDFLSLIAFVYLWANSGVLRNIVNVQRYPNA